MTTMLSLATVLTAALFLYLGFALLYPERLS